MAEYTGNGRVYCDDRFLADVTYEIIIEHDVVNGSISAEENLERLVGGLLPELILQLTIHQMQFRFLPLRADSVVRPYVYDVIPRGQPESIS